ncbi:MAG: chlorophyll synthase ChlG [Chloroflexaceae bacterium]|nr:chlorophyll synthase ChlG [Chloroflexaceae bacterium]
MKPITWFAPGWAFLCGAVASGALSWSLETMGRLFLGLLMAGPILCGLSQIINDYCDREVDAINEPQRLIPAGVVSLQHVQITAVFLTLLGCGLSLLLGTEVAFYVGIGLLFAVAYSMKPIRAKRNGWIGNALVSFSYEGLAWLAGHVTFAVLSWPSALLALFYSLGAHGIMTVNDFKSIDGDRHMGIRSIPVIYGKQRAAILVVIKMTLAQLMVIGLLFFLGKTIAAGVVLLLLLCQIWPYNQFLRDPEHNAVFFNGTAIALFVWGMLASAIGLAW